MNGQHCYTYIVTRIFNIEINPKSKHALILSETSDQIRNSPNQNLKQSRKHKQSQLLMPQNEGIIYRSS